MDTETVETYKEYRIEINSVPSHQFIFGGFGWAFRVFKDDDLCFRMVIKTASSKNADDNKIHVLAWGKKKIHEILDAENFEKKVNYCYQWENVSATPFPQKVNCDNVLKKTDEII